MPNDLGNPLAPRRGECRGQGRGDEPGRPDVLRLLAGRNEGLEREIGHITLEAVRAGHDGGATRACRQDRQQQPGGRLGVGVAADAAVVSEAMRLHPPAWTLERTAVADDDVCGTPVPAGSMVAVLPYLIHRNPAVWPNPAGFDPARFLSPAPGRHR